MRTWRIGQTREESRKERREDERKREDSRGEERFHIFVVFNII